MRIYSLIVVDVYLGGDVPNHFLTKEAVEMYMNKLDDEGVVVFHITNHEGFEGRLWKIAHDLNLESVVAYERYEDEKYKKNYQGLLSFPEDSGLRSRISKAISGVTKFGEIDDQEDDIYGWVVLSRKKSSIKSLIENKRWFALEKEDEEQDMYTDEYIGYDQDKGSITQEVD